jgi:hypothetical protein
MLPKSIFSESLALLKMQEVPYFVRVRAAESQAASQQAII